MKSKENFVPHLQNPTKALETVPAPHESALEAVRTVRDISTRRLHVEDDWGARPNKRYPYPIILIHGTGADNSYWEKLATQLREIGYCVFAPNYGNFAYNPLHDNALQVASYCDAVLTVTSAKKLILIGHSQGGLLARFYSVHHPDKVGAVITLAATHKPTAVADFIKSTHMGENALKDLFGHAGWEQINGSPFYTDLEKHSCVDNGVQYTCLATRTDGTVVPPEHSFLEPGGNIHNMWVQDIFPKSRVPHTLMPTDKDVRSIVVNTLGLYIFYHGDEQ